MPAALYDIPLHRISGADATLGDYRGKVLLLVNVASKCGLTPQYAGLERLYACFQPLGLVVAGFPANDFASQEPGTNDEIAGFCSLNFGVTFPLFEKMAIVGPHKHPLYQALTSAKPTTEDGADAPFRAKLSGYGIAPNPAPEVLWNFEKFLVGRSGAVVKRFAPDTDPEAPALVAAITAELGA
jgi:glutathione peroxidase